MTEIQDRLHDLDGLDVPDVYARARAIGPKEPQEPRPSAPRQAGGILLAFLVAAAGFGRGSSRERGQSRSTNRWGAATRSRGMKRACRHLARSNVAEHAGTPPTGADPSRCLVGPGPALRGRAATRLNQLALANPPALARLVFCPRLSPLEGVTPHGAWQWGFCVAPLPLVPVFETVPPCAGFRAPFSLWRWSR